MLLNPQTTSVQLRLIGKNLDRAMHPCQEGKLLIRKAEGREIEIPSKRTKRLEQGDVFVAKTLGGGDMAPLSVIQKQS